MSIISAFNLRYLSLFFSFLCQLQIINFVWLLCCYFKLYKINFSKIEMICQSTKFQGHMLSSAKRKFTLEVWLRGIKMDKVKVVFFGLM